MRPEARDKLLANADSTARSLGGTSLQDGIEMARRTLAMLTALLDGVKTPELLAKGLDGLEVNPDMEGLMIQAAANGPLLLRWLAMKFNQSAEASLPRVPNRRPAVSGKTQVEILRFVNELNFLYDVHLGDAKQRAAQRFGCGVRTVERYWRQRKKILENGPQLHFHDLLNELITAIDADLKADPAVNSKDVEALLAGLGLKA